MHVCTLTSFHFFTVSASALETVIILSTLEVGPRVDKIFKAESILEGVESVRIVNVLVKLERMPKEGGGVSDFTEAIKRLGGNKEASKAA